MLADHPSHCRGLIEANSTNPLERFTMKPNTCFLVLAALSLLAGPALAEADTRPDHPQRVAQVEIPLDVTALARRGQECRQWLDTTISDAASDYIAEHALVRLRCDAFATDKAALRLKYEHSPRVLESIDIAGNVAQ